MCKSLAKIKEDKNKLQFHERMKRMSWVFMFLHFSSMWDLQPTRASPLQKYSFHPSEISKPSKPTPDPCTATKWGSLLFSAGYRETSGKRVGSQIYISNRDTFTFYHVLLDVLYLLLRISLLTEFPQSQDPFLHGMDYGAVFVPLTRNKSPFPRVSPPIVGLGKGGHVLDGG